MYEATGFVVKDSGQPTELGGGMIRDTEDGKTDFTLVFDGPMLERWASHLTKGAKKYAARNWMKIANATREEQLAALERFKRSFARHQFQYMRGDTDEDHAAAMFFNLNGMEFVKGLLEKK